MAAGTTDRNSRQRISAPYQNNEEYLNDEMRRLDLLLHIRVLDMQSHSPRSPLDAFKGIVLTDEEMLDILEFPDGKTSDLSREDKNLRTKLAKEAEQLAKDIRRRRQDSVTEGIRLPINHLGEICGLSEFDERCLLFSLAPEIDLKYEKLYAYLQDDITRKKPTVHFLLQMLCPAKSDRIKARSRFHARSPLLENQLLIMSNRTADEWNSLLSSNIVLDPAIVNFLLGLELPDERLPGVQWMAAKQGKTGPVGPSSSRLCERLSEAARPFLPHGRQFESLETEKGGRSANHRSPGNMLIQLSGPKGLGKIALVQDVCGSLHIPLVQVDVSSLMKSEEPFERLALLLCREAALRSAALCVMDTDSNEAHTDTVQAGSGVDWNTLIEQSIRYSNLVFMVSEESQMRVPEAEYPSLTALEVSLGLPDPVERKQLWEQSLAGVTHDGSVNTADLAEKFKFSPGQIFTAADRAIRTAAWGCSDRRVSMGDLAEACRAQLSHRLSKLADKIHPGYGRQDLVLQPDQGNRIDSIINMMSTRHRVLTEWNFRSRLSRGRGLSVLFTGPPGTGKTMAAEVLAHELNQDLYRVDLSRIINKYVGETEKRLGDLFREAEAAGAILFFDEADALFGKRSEVKGAQDRYSNTEVAFLLQQMEEYDGMSILATNLNHNLDEAFTRRIQVRIDFPVPDESGRLRLWMGIFPKETPLAKDIDLLFMARAFKLSGGYIKNIAVAAAHDAAGRGEEVGMSHLVPAAKRELEKTGILCRKEDLAQYGELL